MSNVIRVRQILDSLSYGSLLTRNAIFNMTSFITNPEVMKVKRYPPFVYSSQDFATFGMIMDYVVRAGLKNKLTDDLAIRQFMPNIVSHSEPALNNPRCTGDPNVYQHMVNTMQTYSSSKNMNDIAKSSINLAWCMLGTSPYTIQDIYSYVPSMVNTVKDLAVRWQTYENYLGYNIQYNATITYQNIQGHPDILTDTAVLDIKTTSSFKGMAEYSCMQVLAYYALLKASNPNTTVRYVGFVLPMQREIYIFDVSNWDSSSFLNVLLESANPTQVSPEELMSGYAYLRSVNLGSHIHKSKSMSTAIASWIFENPGCPAQLFSGNPQNGLRDADTDNEIKLSRDIIVNNKASIYIHAPYVINLCSATYQQDGYWALRLLINDLYAGNIMGCKGVVVHTGAKVKLDEVTALNIMELLVREALKHATEDCKLLLETPCGEGTEVCTTLETLALFCKRFTEEERNKLGICVDTCHIFAAGYDPYDYIQRWDPSIVPISLIHFNDSEDIRGSRHDRHALPGMGKIGIQKLTQVAQWANLNKVPMVKE